MPIGILEVTGKWCKAIPQIDLYYAAVGSLPRLIWDNHSSGIALKPALRTLGLDLVVAPPSSQRTLDLGIKHNPEMICTPCKLLFGNYVQVLEQGCQVLVMLGGPGTCRLGYSARQQERWLR
jgi:predicted nucleotide-binding protein (sugar kinase/HSP70/actin superfamily)